MLSSDMEFNTLPNFVNKTNLQIQLACGLCGNILLHPHQTACGYRVCKSCIVEKFGDKSVIVCPLFHEDLDDDELLEELCQQKGLKREYVVPDHSIQRALLNERCHCLNQPYGCAETPQWKHLKAHHDQCALVPKLCSNLDCSEMFARQEMPCHLAECGFAVLQCLFCNNQFKRNEMEEHQEECEYAEVQCNECGNSFPKRKQLLVHQKTHPPCLLSAGKCYYYEYCTFESSNLNHLKEHMCDSLYLHLEYITIKMHVVEEQFIKNRKLGRSDMNKAIDSNVNPLEKHGAELAIKVQELKLNFIASEKKEDQMLDSMRAVAPSLIDSLSDKLKDMNSRLHASEYDRVGYINEHTRRLERHEKVFPKMDKEIEGIENRTCNGMFIWKIDDYSNRKNDAETGEVPFIVSPTFYSSSSGYRMSGKAYLNGYGASHGKYLSMFFVLMKGEFDDLLHFPFQQQVTFSLLCPGNPSKSKHDTFKPDPRNSLFSRPLKETNIETGRPEFALHDEILSEGFLINNCIYIRIRVRPGGEEHR